MVIVTRILCLHITLLRAVSSIGSVRQDENCDSFSPDAFTNKNSKMHISKHRFPFRINLSSNIYGDRSTIIVNIEGPDNSSFIVQMKPLHSDNRVGQFQTLLPQSPLRPIICQEFDPTIMGTVEPLTSANVTFHWLSPSTDKGTLTLMGIFISGDEYWIVKGGGPKLFYQKPTVQKQRTDGCVTRYDGSDLCKEVKCEYHLFYELKDDRKTIKVKMRGTGTKMGVYLGMAITNNVNQKMDDVMVVSCIFSDGGLKVSSRNEIQLVIKNKPVVDIDSRNFDCNFLLSLELLVQTIGTSSYLAYFWGNINPNTDEMIFPPAQSIRESFQPIIPDGTPRNSCYFKYLPLDHNGSSSTCHFSPIIFIISIIICYMLPLSINIVTTRSTWMNHNEFKRAPR